MVNFERIIDLLTRYCDRIAQVAVVAMMLLVVANILGRFIGMSIFGTYDYVGFINAILVAFAVAYCAVKKGHIQVEMVVTRFPGQVQKVIGIITGILSLGIFAVITWQLVILANDKWRGGELSMTALIPFHHYIYGVAFGCALLCLVILLELIKLFIRVEKR
jgi:TRAP-type C4-dicarboxylate transport system permease small subunit